MNSSPVAPTLNRLHDVTRLALPPIAAQVDAQDCFETSASASASSSRRASSHDRDMDDLYTWSIPVALRQAPMFLDGANAATLFQNEHRTFRAERLNLSDANEGELLALSVALHARNDLHFELNLSVDREVEITPVALAALADLPFAALTLGVDELNDAHCAALSLLRAPLNLHFTEETESIDVEAIAGIPTLQSLSLGDYPVSAAVAHKLAAHPRLRHISGLDLDNEGEDVDRDILFDTDPEYTGDAAIVALAVSRSLTSLDISMVFPWMIHEHSYRALAASQSISSLHLPQPISPYSLHIGAFTFNSTLRHLSINLPNLKRLPDIATMPNLESLKVKVFPEKQELFEYLAWPSDVQSTALRRFASLTIENASFTQSALSTLATVSVNTLTLLDCGYFHSDAVNALWANHALSSLTIDSWMSPGGGRLLASHPTLTKLQLSNDRTRDWRNHTPIIERIWSTRARAPGGLTFIPGSTRRDAIATGELMIA